eukprot:TRINITY_DN3813_c0_g2_i1.p2 TRINITY_DN3813_c0_g2~~TRINITY_DN3813_c0_g2_i1.p2  ORF type:complete len:122 (+),score=33.35 TRINITY_DN3813_c0_g2_i1:487-852(+)
MQANKRQRFETTQPMATDSKAGEKKYGTPFRIPTPNQKGTNSPVERFQRIKTDSTQFIDRRLANNSFSSKGETWGASAAYTLGKVKGDRFRHEKTKKKRGTYKGSGIDLQPKSITLDSDDE